MPAKLFTPTDKIITCFIKDFIKSKNLSLDTLAEILNPIFTKEDLYKILEGNYIFTIKEFAYITKKLNINIDSLDYINNTIDQIKIN